MDEPYMNLEPADFFNLLESNQPSVVEDIKCLIHDHLNVTKEAWLVQGLYDYTLAKSSQRAMEILLGLREPHAKHLFDKLSESLRSGQRLSALIFMGFLVRRQPQWLHKISSHYVMKDLIKIIKMDGDVVVLVNALLVLTALLPIIPNLEASILNDIFEGFSRLAAWNYSNQPRQPEVYVLHLQIALYALFHRLYGMYPCNFLSYLRSTYSLRENLPIFSHTVKPMVETVRMHPLLVTASKDIEIGTARWKQMSVHDIVTECAKYSLLECQEMAHREDLTCSLVHSTSCSVEHQPHSQTSWPGEALNGEWSSPCSPWISAPPSKLIQTPLSRVVTPKMESDGQLSVGRVPLTPITSAPVSSGAARNLSLTPTPMASAGIQPPTSPMKKDAGHAFKYPEGDRRGSVISGKLQKIGQESSTSFAVLSGVLSGMRSRHSSGAPVADARKNLTSPAAMTEPLSSATFHKDKDRDKDITPEDREVSRLLAPRPKECLDKDSHALSQTWVHSREGTPLHQSGRPDSLLQDKIGDHRDDDEDAEGKDAVSADDDEDEDERAEREESVEVGGNSPCYSGGLHMPDKRHISDFVRRVKRLRYFSQCLPIATTAQGSPGSGSSIGTVVDSIGASGTSAVAILHPSIRKRSTSCPDLHKSLVEASSWDWKRDSRSKGAALLVVDESVVRNPAVADGSGAVEGSSGSIPAARGTSVASQTEDLWPPTPYEHLFFSVLPPSLFLPPPMIPADSTSPRPVAPTELLDRYIDAAFRNHERQVALHSQGKFNASDDVALLKGQVLLLQSQLQFERHRREVHAERNRRLLSKAKNLRFLEEEVHTLRLQLVQTQNEMTALRRDADHLRRARNAAESDRSNAVRQLELKMRQNLQEIGELTSGRSHMEEELSKLKEENRQLRRTSDQFQAVLFDAEAEMAELKRRANDSRRYQQELKDAQYHLIAARETANALQQQLMQPSGAQSKFEVEELTRAFKEEMKGHRENLERERRLNEALTAKLTDLEANAVKRETEMAELKRFLQTVKEEHQQLILVLEQKYESLKSINFGLESSIMQLRHQADYNRTRLHSRRRQILTPAGSGADHWGVGDQAIISAPPPAPGFSPSPGSPPSFSSHSGTSAEQLSVSLAVEASEGLNELYWQGIESSALSEVADLPLEQAGEQRRASASTAREEDDPLPAD